MRAELRLLLVAGMAAAVFVGGVAVLLKIVMGMSLRETDEAFNLVLTLAASVTAVLSGSLARRSQPPLDTKVGDSDKGLRHRHRRGPLQVANSKMS